MQDRPITHAAGANRPRSPGYAVRRAMTDARGRADDRSVRFVGVEAYAEAGGALLPDLEKAARNCGAAPAPRR